MPFMTVVACTHSVPIEDCKWNSEEQDYVQFLIIFAAETLSQMTATSARSVQLYL